jgi:xanthine dehydrogenase accessory factor
VWGLGLGCNGLVDVFVQPATEGPLAAVAEPLRELLAGDSPFAIATVISSAEDLGLVTLGEQAAGRSGVVCGVGREVFVEVLPPPPHLLVCGAGDDARPLVACAAAAGFRVTLVDHRLALLEPQRFPQAARLVLARSEAPDLPAGALPPAGRSLAVVKTHSLAHDREWVRRLLAAGVPYIGVLGPRERTVTILQEIGAADPANPPDTARVFGPVGLDLGADGPFQVAVSIVAELLAFTAQRTPRHLCERREAIHAV